MQSSLDLQHSEKEDLGMLKVVEDAPVPRQLVALTVKLYRRQLVRSSIGTLTRVENPPRSPRALGVSFFTSPVKSRASIS